MPASDSVTALRLQQLAYAVCALLLAGCGSAPEQPDTAPVNQRFTAFVAGYHADMLALDSPKAQRHGAQASTAEWNDFTASAIAQRAMLIERTRAVLNDFDREKLSTANRLNYDLIDYVTNRAETRNRFPLHDFPINAVDGVHLQLVRQLTDWHPITSAADARAYIEQVKSTPDVVAKVIAALIERRKAGIIAPRFTLQRSVSQLEELVRGQPLDPRAASDHPLWADFNSKLDQLALPEEQADTLRGNLRIELSTRYRKAMLDLRRQVDRHASVAEEMGAWNLPDGTTWYRELLNIAAADGLTPDSLHYMAKQDIKRLREEIDAVIAQLGYHMDPRQFFPYTAKTGKFYYSDDDYGQQRAISDANAVIDAMFPSLRSLFNELPTRMVQVAARSDKNAPGSFYLPASPDWPGDARFVINTGNTEEIPVWQLAAATLGQTWPGRHLQHATAAERPSIAGFRQHIDIPAYEEGWRLYAEYLALEAGVYRDPWDNYGRLVSELSATVAIVIDTGIHHKRWTIDRAAEFARDNLPIGHRRANRWVRRMFVKPAQATAAKRGLMQLLDLRATAQQSLGEHFDIRAFHEAVLGGGPLPMTMLQQRVYAWIDATRDSNKNTKTEQER